MDTGPALKGWETQGNSERAIAIIASKTQNQYERK